MAWWNNLFGGSSGFSQSDINSWGTLQNPMINNSLTVDPWANGYTPSYGNSTASITDAGTPIGWTPAIGNTNTRSIFDSPNVLNASITSALYGLSAFAQAWSSKDYYKYYEKQEQLYIENAKIQADRLETAGKIEAANIRAKHAITQGQNELAVVGAGAGSISGSFADYLTANRKNDARDEYAQDLSTLYAVSNAKRQGLTQAFSTAGQAYAQAIKQRNASVSRIFSGLAEGVGSILADIRSKDQADFGNTSALSTQEQQYGSKYRYYGNAVTGNFSYKTEDTEASILNPNGTTGNVYKNIEDATQLESQYQWPYDIINPTERGI